MNRACHRIVFNKKRGQLMVVAESAVGAGKGAGTTAGRGGAGTVRWAGLRRLSFSLLLAFGGAAVVSEVPAQIAAYKAAPGGQRPTVLSAGNGVPVVNIQTPSAAGVSHNAYSQFDVGPPGVLLNNSRSNAATQLGGWIQGNPWLARGTARVILNEVVSSPPSLLGGYIEVAGDKAQVIVANPAGVTCSGCGFLNAHRVTLTTGTPLLSNGALDGYRVAGGTVRIDGAGMDAARADATDLIARAVEINAGLWAQALQITAGANRVDAAHTQATPIPGAGPAPAFALDVAQLGGMYAHTIRLIGTEAGVGVRNAGTLAAAAGEVLVTAEGRLINRGTVVSGEAPLSVNTRGLDNSGTLSSEGTLTVASPEDILNTGLLHAGRELILATDGQLATTGTLDGQRLDLAAGTFRNDGTVRQSGTQALFVTAARVDNATAGLIGHLTPTGGASDGGSDGTVSAPTSAAGGTLTAAATPPSSALADGRIAVQGELANAGEIVASGTFSLTATEKLANAGTLTLERLTATGTAFRNQGAVTAADAAFSATTFDNSGGTLAVAGPLVLQTQKLANVQGQLRHAGSDAVHLQVTELLDNHAGRIVSNAADLDLAAGALDNTDGRIEHAGRGALTLTSGRLTNTAGTLESQGAVTVQAGTAGTVDNAAGRVSAAGTLTLTAGTLDNHGGTLAADGLLKVAAGSLDNRAGGQIVTDAALIVTTAGALNNAGGVLSSQQALTLAAEGDLANAAGQIVAQTDLTLSTDGALDNRGGLLGAVAGRLDVAAAGAIDNAAGRIEAATHLTLSGAGLANAGGTVLGQTLTVDTHGQALDNTEGLLAAETTLAIDSGALTNTQGLIQAGGALTIDTYGQKLVNRDTAATDGLGIRGQGPVTLTAGAVDNAGGLVNVGESLVLTASALDNQGGRLIGNATGTLTVSGLLDNRGGTLATDGVLTVKAGTLDNRSAGQVVTNATLAVTTTGALKNAGGALSSQQALTLTAEGDVANAGGQIVAQTDLTLNTDGALDNAGGTLGAVTGAVDLTAGGAINSVAGRIEAAKGVVLSSQGLTNSQGTVLGQTLAIKTHGKALDNTRGILAAEKTLAIDSGELTNTQGRIQAGGALTVDTHGQKLVNRDTAGAAGLGLRAQGPVTLTAGSVDNAAGLISAGTSLALNADTLDNRGGDLQAGGDLTARATDRIDNGGGLMRANGTLALVTAHLDNTETKQDGTGIEAATVDLTAARLDNAGGAVRADDALILRSTQRLDNTGGLVSSQKTLDVIDPGATRTLAIDNAGGTFLAGTRLSLQAQGLSGAGTLVSHGDLALDTVANLHHTGTLTTAGDLRLTTAGTVTNDGTLQAGDTLAIAAQALTNTATGTLAGDAVDLAIAGTLTNRGLIDGGETRIHAGTLDNLGTGRIYGDHLALAAGTLNNLAEGGIAPIIAARTRLALGVGTLANRDGALLFAAGDLALGGGLDTAGHATGQAGSIDNASATIEALTNLSIDTASLVNRKTAFATATVPDTTPLTGTALLDYVPDLQFHWPLAESSITTWRNYIRDRYINVIAKLLGGGPDAYAVALYNQERDPDQAVPMLPWVMFPNVWGDLTGYTGPTGGGLSDAERARLAAAVNARDPVTLADSHAIWRVLVDTLAAEHPGYIDQMAAALTAQGVSPSLHRQICTDPTDDCSYVNNTAATITATRDVVTVDSPAAVIRAGGAMAIAATALENRYSLIQSGGDMVLTGATLTNVGAELHRVTDTTETTRRWHWVNRDHGSTTGASSTQTLIGGVPGLIVAGGTLTGSFTGHIDNLTIRQNAAPVTGQTGTTPGTTGAGSTGPAAVGADAAQTGAGSGATTARTAQAAAADAAATPNTAAARTTQAGLAETASTQGAGTARTALSAAADSATVTAGGGPRITQVAAATPGGPASLIATAEPTLALPANRLYHVAPGSSAGYLVETDPAFAHYRTWLSSDTLLSALGITPAADQKRLGDGFYEQRLITEQIGALTGRRFLDGYANDEDQYRALMAAGATVAQAWHLIPGVALTAEQMAQLTTDIVWLVERSVTLADGSTQRVLVPQVYARVRESDLTPAGALLAANDIALATAGDLTTSGTIAGRQTVVLGAENLAVQRGRISGRDVAVQAATDLTVQGGTIEAERTLVARAGRDLTVASSTVDRTYAPREGRAVNAAVQTTVIDRVAGLYVTGAGGTLVAAAGRDLTLLAAVVANAASTDTGGGTLLSAGNNLALGTVNETRAASTRSKGNRWREATNTEVGSTVLAAGDLTLAAGNDLTARTAEVAAAGALAASAGHDLTITTGEATRSSETWHKSTKSGFLSKRMSERLDTLDTTTAISSSFSGDTVTLAAGNDLTVTGSRVVAQGDLSAVAGRDVLLDTAQDIASETHLRKEKSSGLSASYGGLSYGKSSLKQNADATTVTQVGSTLSGENVTLVAGRDTVIRAAGVLADNDLTVLAGRNIDVLAAANTQDVETHTKSSSNSIGLTPNLYGRWTLYGKSAASQDTDDHLVSQSTSLLSANAGDLTLRAGLDSRTKGTGQGNLLTEGADLLAGDALTLSGNAVALLPATDETSSHSLAKTKSFTVGARLAGPIGEIIDSIGQMAERATHTDNDRLQGAYALKAGYDAWKLYENGGKLADGAATAADAVAKANPQQMAGATSGMAGSGIGVQVHVGSSKSKSESSSHTAAVTGTNLQAKTIDISATETDLVMQGAKVQAEDIRLTAERDILLTAAANTAELHSKDSGSSAGFGVTFSFGGQQNGFSVQISASRMKGKANGAETAWDNTLVTASDSLTVKSGRDTTLHGAQLAGESVLLDVGGNLLIESLQDQSRYESKQKSSGFDISLCIPPFCYGTAVTGSISASEQKIKHAYQSAVGQSGIAAGDGGFDIAVKGHTELVGAAITSTAETNKTTFTTASLSSTDLTNTQVTKSSSSSASVGYGGGSALATLASNTTSNLLTNLNGNVALPKNQNETSTTQSVISPANVTITGTGNAEQDAQSRQTADDLMARDPATANGSLTNTLSLQQAQVLEEKLQKQKENQLAGQLVGSVLAGAVGDVAQAMRQPVDDARERSYLDQKIEKGEALTAGEAKTLARLDAEGMTSAKAQATLSDPDLLARYEAWGEGSASKTLLHGLAGVIAAKVGDGSVAAGAIGGMTQEQLAPLLSEYLEKQGILSGSSDYNGLMQLGMTLAGTTLGAATGGTQGAATGATTAFVGVTNNFLGHQDQARLIKLRAKKYDDLTTNEKQQLAALEQADQQSDYLLGLLRREEALSDTEKRQLDAYLYRYAQQDGLAAARVLLEFGAPNVGNYGYAFALGKYQAEYDQVAKEAGLGRSTFRSPQANESFASWLTNPFATRPAEETRYNQIVAEQGGAAAIQNSFDRQAAQSLQDGLGLVGAGGYAGWLTKLATSSKVVGGAALGGGFYTAGQAYKGEDVRFGELMVNMGTGAATASLVTTNAIINAALGGAVGAANTAAANWIYGENQDVERAFWAGAGFSTLGIFAGKGASSIMGIVSPAYIGGKPLNPSVPILLQNVGKPNPYPGYIGATIEQGISNYPSFQKEEKK